MLDLEETVFQFDPQTRGVWHGGKDPIGLIKVSKLAVVSATRNPSTAEGVGGELGRWRKERQLRPYSETPGSKNEGEGGGHIPGVQGKLCRSEIMEDSSQTLPWWNPHADLGTRPRYSHSVVSEVI